MTEPSSAGEDLLFTTVPSLPDLALFTKLISGTLLSSGMLVGCSWKTSACNDAPGTPQEKEERSRIQITQGQILLWREGGAAALSKLGDYSFSGQNPPHQPAGKGSPEADPAGEVQGGSQKEVSSLQFLVASALGCPSKARFSPGERLGPFCFCSQHADLRATSPKSRPGWRMLEGP